jgi:glycosyltransferase involved in cell wall biosynthesis
MNELIPFPPEGYQFTTGSGLVSPSIANFSRLSVIEPSLLPLYRTLLYLLPLNVIKSYLDSKMTLPKDIDLIYGALPLGAKKPYIVEFDTLWVSISSNIRYVRLFKKLLERSFTSGSCKRILYWFNHSKTELLTNLNCSRFEQKLEKLPLAVHRHDFLKKYDDSKVRLLFLGSANVSGAFEMRGGILVLEAIRKLSGKYENIGFVIRSDIPKRVRERFADVFGLRQVTLLERHIPKDELEQIYKTVDMFLLPAYYDNWLSVLEAKSYGLPVIVADVYANREIVEDGKTGLLIRKSKEVPYYINGIRSPGALFLPGFRHTIQNPEREVVEDMVEKTSLLIEDRQLRRRMGEAARAEVEHGIFSIERRNEILKRIFDEALK